MTFIEFETNNCGFVDENVCIWNYVVYNLLFEYWYILIGIAVMFVLAFKLFNRRNY